MQFANTESVLLFMFPLDKYPCTVTFAQLKKAHNKIIKYAIYFPPFFLLSFLNHNWPYYSTITILSQQKSEIWYIQISLFVILFPYSPRRTIISLYISRVESAKRANSVGSINGFSASLPILAIFPSVSLQ